MANSEVKVVQKNVSELVPYEKNPRKNKEAVKYVKESIDQFGFKVPIIVDVNNVVVAGHTRLLAAKELKMKTVPCIVADDLTEEQIRAFRLADNKVTEFSEWDSALLQEELDRLYGSFDMELFGFNTQIENIDLGVDAEGDTNYSIAAELGEENNYVVLKFDNKFDWDKAVELFGLKMVETDDKNPKIRRHGIGRVINGPDVIKMIEEKKND